MNAVYTSAQSAESEEIKAVVRRVMDDEKTRIYGPDAAVLFNWAHGFSRVAKQPEVIA